MPNGLAPSFPRRVSDLKYGGTGTSSSTASEAPPRAPARRVVSGNGEVSGTIRTAGKRPATASSKPARSSGATANRTITCPLAPDSSKAKRPLRAENALIRLSIHGAVSRSSAPAYTTSVTRAVLSAAIDAWSSSFVGAEG